MERVCMLMIKPQSDKDRIVCKNVRDEWFRSDKRILALDADEHEPQRNNVHAARDSWPRVPALPFSSTDECPNSKSE